MRRRTLLAAVPLVLVIGGAVCLGAQGDVDTFGSAYPAGAARPASAPDWTAPCWRRPPRSDRELLERCVRVRGRVVWVQSDGPHDFHLAVVARLRLFSVRVPPRVDPPDALSNVTAVGALVRDRLGLDQVDAVAIE